MLIFTHKYGGYNIIHKQMYFDASIICLVYTNIKIIQLMNSMAFIDSPEKASFYQSTKVNRLVCDPMQIWVPHVNKGLYFLYFAKYNRKCLKITINKPLSNKFLINERSYSVPCILLRISSKRSVAKMEIT